MEKHTVAQHIDALIEVMPLKSKRFGVVTFIRDFNRVLNLTDKIHVDDDIYVNTRFQLYVLKMLRSEYMVKLNNFSLKHDADLSNYMKNYVVGRIRNKEKNYTDIKYVLKKLKGKQ